MVNINIVFKKIKLHNFFSFNDVEVNLDDMGYTLVSGRNNCKLDNAYSNGSGKSSVFNAICFALTGETSQGVSNNLGNIFSDPHDCWVELTFNVDNDEFIIKRISEPKSAMQLYINGENKSGKGIRESSKLLSTYLPDLTSILVNSIIILGQGLPNRFTNNNPAQRKEILEKLTKSDFMIQSIKDKLELRQQTLKTNLRVSEDSLLANKSQLKVYQNQAKSYENDLKEYDKYDNSESNLELLISNLEKELNRINTEVDNLEESIKKETASVDKYTSDKLEYNNAKFNNPELTEAVKPLEELLKETKKKEDDARVSLRVKKNELKSHEVLLENDICPTCGQKISTELKLDLYSLKEEISTLDKQWKDTVVMGESIKNQIESIKKDNEKKYNKLIDDIDAKINTSKNYISSFNNSKNSLIGERNNITSELYTLNNLKTNYKKLVENISINEGNIKKLKADNKKIDAEIININSHLDVVQQMITLAKREFRGVLLINVINYINKRIKQYSKEVFDNEGLNFSLDDNSIDISYFGKPYENLSGGERQKIDVVVQLALRDVLNRQLNIHSNLLVCDEIFDNLDSQGCNKIINLISSLTDINSIFIISHHTQDLEITRDNELLIEKGENGISTIRFV